MLLWSKVVQLMSLKQNLTSSGFYILITYYASINRGVSSLILNTIPGIVGATRPGFVLSDSLNPNWLSGFIAGEEGFVIGIRPDTNQS